MSVNLSLLGGAGWQFFTDNGTPLAGGLLYTYLAGTSTAATTYTTSAGNVPNSNPIVLNSAGRVQTEIWLTQGVSYKFVLKTSAFITIGTYDNIDGAADPAPFYAFEAALTASSGSSLVGFIQSGSGAVATTVQAKLRESVSVLDFGGADFSIQLQAAIDSMPSAGGVIHCEMTTGTQTFSQAVTVDKPLKIYLGAATYDLGVYSLNITSSGASLLGISKQNENNSATRFTYSGNNSAIRLKRSTTATYLSGVVLENFEVSAVGAAITDAGGIGIDSTGTRYCDFRNIEIYNFTAGFGMFFTGNGTVVDGFGATNNIYNPALSTNKYGIKVDNSGGSASTHGCVYGGYSFGTTSGFETACESWRIYGTDLAGTPCVNIKTGADDTALIATRYEAFASAIVVNGVVRTQIIAPSFINTAAGTELTDNGVYTTVVSAGANTPSKLSALQMGNKDILGANIFTLRGTTASIAGTGGTETITTLGGGGHYILAVSQSDGGTVWRGNWVLTGNGSTVVITTLDSANMTCTNSGADIVLTNTNAVAQSLYWSLLKLL